MATVHREEIPSFKMIFAKIKSIQGARKELMTVYTIIGLLIGITTLKKITASLAPSRYAASCRDVGTVSKKPFAIRYPKPEDAEYTNINPK